MPEIARFYGIVIKMFFKPKEHEPSHIHALYGEYMGEFNVASSLMDTYLSTYPDDEKAVRENIFLSTR